MASICGIVSQHGKIEEDTTKPLGKMIKLTRHRGPDNVHVRTLPDARGSVGAAEINLTPRTTHCTAINDDPPYILFDGELFNDRPEGMSDLELFKDYWEKYERGCFSRLDGSFTCAVVEKDEEVILARDHVGPRPLFFGEANQRFFFCSEMKGLADHIPFTIHELAPGQIYSTKKGMKEFDKFEPDIPQLGHFDEAVKTVRDLLIESVEERMEGVKAVSLSGGLDSSIIAAIAKEYNPDLHLFTVAVQSAPGPDLENAKLMADFLGMEHHIYDITDEDIDNFLADAVWYLESFDEDCISGILSNYYASKMVKNYSDAVLVGEGADELFGGYRMVLKNPKVKSPEQRERLAKKLLEIAYNTALRRLDRAWMANAVAYKTPFLDTKVVAFCDRIPMDWKIYGERQIEKYILREAFRDMLPEQIANREKLRFAMGSGMDDVMDEIISQKIDPNEIKQRPKAAYGLPFASFKELYYYDEFLKQFPPSYERQTIRWDPFK